MAFSSVLSLNYFGGSVRVKLHCNDYITTCILEILGVFFNLNKMKTKMLSMFYCE